MLKLIHPVRLFVTALALAAGFAAPAAAADLATLSCVEDKLTDEVRTLLADDVQRNLAATGEKHSYAEAVTGALRDAANACASEYNWPDEARRPAALYTLAKLAMPVADRIAAERGLDPSALESIWFTVPEESRNRPITPEVNRILSDATAGAEDQSKETAELVGEFFGFLSMKQYCSYDFSQA